MEGTWGSRRAAAASSKGTAAATAYRYTATPHGAPARDWAVPERSGFSNFPADVFNSFFTQTLSYQFGRRRIVNQNCFSVLQNSTGQRLKATQRKFDFVLKSKGEGHMWSWWKILKHKQYFLCFLLNWPAQYFLSSSATAREHGDGWLDLLLLWERDIQALKIGKREGWENPNWTHVASLSSTNGGLEVVLGNEFGCPHEKFFFGRNTVGQAPTIILFLNNKNPNSRPWGFEPGCPHEKSPSLSLS
jgi:hypothetical protein